MATFIPNVTDAFPEPALYRPDFGFMDKMLSRRQQMYERGFSEVAGKYGDLTRELTNPKNVQQRDSFLKEAMNNLKNLSSMDLSQQQNVDAAGSVFSPFWKNTHVLADMMLTKHYNQQENIAEGFRLKDGGKEYSDDNINFVRLQRQAFAKDDPMNYGKYYQDKAYFTPYHDVDKEMREIMKDFKPDDISMTTIKGFYFYKEQDASVRPEAVRKYLEGTLSDKAKQQLRISAAVRYGTNPQAVVANYASTASSNVKQINGELERVNNYLKVERDPAKKEELKAYKTQLEDSKGVYTNHLDRIKSGDASFLSGKINDLAYEILYNEKINDFSKAQARKVYKLDITENGVALGIWKEQQANARAARREKFDLELERLKASGALEPILETGRAKGNNLNLSISDIKSEYEKAENTKRQLSADFNKFIISYWKGDGTKDSNDRLTEADLIKLPGLVDKFLEENPHLKAVQDYKEQINLARSTQQAYQSIYTAAGVKASASLTTDQKKALQSAKTQVGKLGPVALVDNGRFVNFQSDQLFDGIVDGSVTVKYTGGVTQLNIQGRTYTLNPKGNDVFVKQAIEKVKNIENLAKTVPNVSSAMSTYTKAMNDYFTKVGQEEINWIAFGDESKRAKLKIGGINTLLATSTTEGTIKAQDIKESTEKNRTYFTINKSSNAKMTIDGKLVAPTEDDFLKLMTAQGKKVGKDAFGFYIDHSDVSNNPMFKNFTQIETMLYQADKYAGDGFASGFWYPLGTGNYQGKVLPQFRYEKLVGADGSPKYHLYDGTGGGMIGGKEYRSLADLFEDAKSYSIHPEQLRAHKMR
jgi:hypothetical protein